MSEPSDYDTRCTRCWKWVGEGPAIALRPDRPEDPHNAEMVQLDDVVVTGVQVFRAEFMDDQHIWLACYLEDGSDIHFSVYTKRAPIKFIATQVPAGLADYDERNARGETTDHPNVDRSTDS